MHWPPLIYVATLVAAWLLERFAPPPALPESLLVRWFGAALVLTGIGIGLAGILAFRRVDTTFDPTGSANALATEGIYTRTRNPMYLGALIAYAGLGLALRSSWLLVALPVMYIALTRLAIEPEEAYLDRRFGDAFRNYKRQVRRWI